MFSSILWIFEHWLLLLLVIVVVHLLLLLLLLLLVTVVVHLLLVVVVVVAVVDIEVVGVFFSENLTRTLTYKIGVRAR